MADNTKGGWAVGQVSDPDLKEVLPYTTAVPRRPADQSPLISGPPCAVWKTTRSDRLYPIPWRKPLLDTSDADRQPLPGLINYKKDSAMTASRAPRRSMTNVDAPGRSLDRLADLVHEDPVAQAAYEDALVRESLPKAMVDARTVSGRSQTEVAEAMGTVQSVVSQLENNRASDIQVGTAQRWARGVGRRLDVAVVPNYLPTYAQEGLPNVLWALIHKYTLSPILTTLVKSRNDPSGRTLRGLSEATKTTTPIVQAIVGSLSYLDWVTNSVQYDDEGSELEVYSLNDQAAYVIGCSLHPRRVEGVLLDVYSNIVNHVTLRTADSSPRAMTEAVANVAGQLRKLAPNQAILGVGVSIAGVVVPQTSGPVVFAPDLDSGNGEWNNYMLESELQAAIQQSFEDDSVRVAVENDANALALLHYWQTGDQNPSVFLMSGAGIGAGYLSRGELFHGAHFAAGEVGHAVIRRRSGTECRLGMAHEDCLETIASADGMLQATGVSVLNDERSLEDRLRSAETLLTRGEISDQSFKDAGVAFGEFVTSFAGTVDPSVIVVYGHPWIVSTESPVGSAFRTGFQSEWAIAESRQPRYELPSIDWRPLEDSTNAVAAGAAAMSCFLAHPDQWRPAVTPESVRATTAAVPELADRAGELAAAV